MDMMQVLLSLRDNNQERTKVDPKTQLAALYREILGLRNGIDAIEKRLEQLERQNQERVEETERLIQSKPKWMTEIEEVKEQLVRKSDLTLKDMLGIQQQVVQLEEQVSHADNRIVDLRMERRQDEQTHANLVAGLKERKAKYNQRAQIYNTEKAQADVRMSEFTEIENELLANLQPRDRATYREALRANPASPVAILEGEICGGCRIGLSTMIVKSVLRGEKLVLCESCQRVLMAYVLQET